MIITFNAREKHHKGKEVIDWYNKLPQSEKSRKIIDILYSHILSDGHTMEYGMGEYPSPYYNYRGGSHL
jgi:hypothetical protein